MELHDFLEEKAQKLKTIARDEGIMWPFLYRRSTGSMLAAKPIKTRRAESLNVCWACLQQGKLTPNGIFFSFDEREHENGILEVKYHPFFFSNIAVLPCQEGLYTLVFQPTKEDYQKMFAAHRAVYIRDKRELR